MMHCLSPEILGIAEYVLGADDEVCVSAGAAVRCAVAGKRSCQQGASMNSFAPTLRRCWSAS